MSESKELIGDERGVYSTGTAISGLDRIKALEPILVDGRSSKEQRLVPLKEMNEDVVTT